ncbi:MAG: hypothetical protein ACRCVD_09085, partial [Halioglobus sp.]
MIRATGIGLRPDAGDGDIDAGGGLLLPGLQDHHIHRLARAASLDSVRCGPPDISGVDELAALLRDH